MYRPLGPGDVDVASIVTTLEGHGYYQGWYTLEQDTILTEEPRGEGPVHDVRISADHVRTLVAATTASESDQQTWNRCGWPSSGPPATSSCARGAERQEPFVARTGPRHPWWVPGAGATTDRRSVAQTFCGKPSSMPPWLGSSQREVTTLPRVKKCTPSMPWAWVSPKRLLFQPPKE